MRKKCENPHKWSSNELWFIRENIAGLSYAEMTDLFNAHYGLRVGLNQMKAVLARLELRNGRDGRFPPGHPPTNKGSKGIRVSIRTEFKPGNRPQNYQPVGTERINANGYIDVKIRDPRTWKSKHRITWETSHGPVPPGHVIIFADGNKMNVDLENLLLVSRSELAVMNHEGLIFRDRTLTKTGQSIAALKIGICGATKRRKA